MTRVVIDYEKLDSFIEGDEIIRVESREQINDKIYHGLLFLKVGGSREVVLKVVEKEEYERVRSILQLVSRNNSLRYCIVPTYALIETKALKYVAMKRMQCDLHQLFFDVKQASLRHKKITLKNRWDIMRQCSEIIEKMHSVDVLHRDIKTKNFLVEFCNQENRFIVSLCDFEQPKIGKDEGVHFGCAVGTKNYMSPEVFNLHHGDGVKKLKTTPYTVEMDTYSLACVLGEILLLEEPFSDPSKERRLNMRESPFKSELSYSICSVLCSTLRNCFANEAEKRPTIKHLKDAILKDSKQMNLVCLEPNFKSWFSTSIRHVPLIRRIIADGNGHRLHNENLLLESVYDNIKVVVDIILNNSDAITRTSANLRDDKDFIVEIMKNHGLSLRYASDRLKDDKDVVFEALKQQEVSFASTGLRGEMKNNSLSVLQYASYRLRDDKDFIVEALRNHGLSLMKYASTRLTEDKELVIEVLNKRGLGILKHASTKLTEAKEFVNEAMNNHGLSLMKYASTRLKDDREFVIGAMSDHGWKLVEHASERLRDDKYFIVEVMNNHGFNLVEYASERLRNDNNFISEAMNYHGLRVLNNASTRLKDDREFVIGAMNNHGWRVVMYASERLKDDKYFLFRIMKNHGLGMMKYASRRQKDNLSKISVSVVYLLLFFTLLLLLWFYMPAFISTTSV